MFWILTASVPADDRVFKIGSKGEFPEPSPWTAWGTPPILYRGITVEIAIPDGLYEGRNHFTVPPCASVARDPLLFRFYSRERRR
jgi:hypothetical protein